MISTVLFDGDTDFILELRNKLNSQNKVKIINTTRDLPELETILKKTRVDVLILGPSLKNEDMATLGELVSSKFPHVAIILISFKITTDLLRDALKAGAKDVLPASASGEQLLQAIEIAHRQSLRICNAVQNKQSESPVTEPKIKNLAKVITFFGAKGGVGTTFIATNIGVSLVEQTKSKVILLDLDLQFGDVAVMLRLQPAHTIYDVVSAMDRLDAEMMKGFLSTHTSGLKVLLAPVMPDKADGISSEEILKIINVLKEMCDYLIIDTPALFDDRILAALDSSDEICLVASLDVPSLKNTKLSLDMIELLKYSKEKVKLVLNRANSKVRLSVKDVEKSLATKTAATIPSDIIVPRSVNKGIPVVIDAPRASVARNLSNFADQVKNGSGVAASNEKQATEIN